jgi:hypothetical protein
MGDPFPGKSKLQISKTKEISTFAKASAAAKALADRTADRPKFNPQTMLLTQGDGIITKTGCHRPAGGVCICCILL